MLSCSEPPQHPASLPSRETMIEVLTDMALAESASGVNIRNVSSAHLDSVYNFRPLEERGIRPESFDSAIHFYSSHPDQYKEIYQEVLNRLSALESAREGSRVDSAGKQ